MRTALILCIFLTGALFAQTYVAPGDGTLSQAITDAADGDILELVPGAEYTESTAYLFGTIVDKSLTIDIESGGEEKARLNIITPPDGESTVRFFEVGDNASLTLRNLELDGSYAGEPNAEYAVTFYLGEFPAPTTVNTIRVENCHIHDFVSDVLAAGGSEMRGNLVVDSTFVDNTVIERTGTSVYYKYCGSHFISITNSTFNTINSYGFRVSGPVETNLPTHTPSVVIDRTTWYNVGTDDGREIILCEKGPHLGTWKVSNSILVKQINKDKTVINIKETLTPEQATINNICMWDVGNRNWRDHPVADTLNMDPQFADPENGDFTLPAGSQLLTYADDGGAIGDPRWATNAAGVKSNPTTPTEFALEQNYPNPFNPKTTISFQLDKAGQTRLVIYDLLGHEMKQVLDKQLHAGRHHIAVDASDLPSGIYLYQLQSSNQIMTRKMTILK